MLRSFEQTRNVNLTLRIAAILSFTVLTALSARVTIEINGVVPFTLQVLVVLLAGMVLGARDGAASQIAYVALIASGMPIDARALGPAALTGPTAGFLFGFIPPPISQAGWSNKVLTRCGCAGLLEWRASLSSMPLAQHGSKQT